MRRLDEMRLFSTVCGGRAPRVRFILLSCALGAFALLSPLFGVASATNTQTIAANADASVSEAHPASNDGSDTDLRVDGTSPMTNAYLRFDVSGVAGSIDNATLRLFVKNGTHGGFDVHGVADSSWNESEITWSNAPSMGPSVPYTGSVEKGQWVSIDVSDIVRGQSGPVSMAITTPASEPVVFASREDGEAAALVVETSASPPTDVAPPSITGQSVAGDTLTATPGDWAGTDPISVAYQWQQCDSGGANCSDIGGATSSSFVIPSGDVGTALRVVVTASNSAGSASASSATTPLITAPTGQDTTPPSVPSGLTVGSTTQTSVAVSWSASTDDVGVTGYDVLVDGSRVSSTASTGFTFSGLTCGTSYTLGVDAFDAAGNHSSASTVTGTTAACSGSTGYQHVVWVVMENSSYSQIIGNTGSAPYINELAQLYGSATQMFAESHPSLPNYIAMTSGSTQGITDDSGPSSHPLNVGNIFTQTGSNGRSLEEAMPSNCYTSDSGNYAVRHNPGVYYTNYTQCGTQDIPLGSTPDLSAAFTFITPDLCHDMHSNSCSGSSNVILQGDQWLQAFVPSLLASPQYRAGTTAIFITWDEDNSCSGCSNQIPTIVISPTTSGITSANTYNHYSMLRTTEEILGITTFLGNAATAHSMRADFHL
jgi:phosphatidylinositol-3-phosphatase